MGLTRKLLSLSTVGMVDFRSDKERTAAYTQRGYRAAEAGNRLLAQQNAILAAQAATIAEQARSIAAVAEARRPMPAGWYGDRAGADALRFWTGAAWADGGTDGPPGGPS